MHPGAHADWEKAPQTGLPPSAKDSEAISVDWETGGPDLVASLLTSSPRSQVLLPGVQCLSTVLAHGEAISQAWVSPPCDPQPLPNRQCVKSDRGRRQGMAG